ncbi:MAG: hypothetical protein PHO89_01275 [Methylacidiphilaceae bacterium]|nr:hypothetical protein [Candidatus Methylacidiphilaceae bacterium]
MLDALLSGMGHYFCQALFLAGAAHVASGGHRIASGDAAIGKMSLIGGGIVAAGVPAMQTFYGLAHLAPLPVF